MITKEAERSQRWGGNFLPDKSMNKLEQLFNKAEKHFIEKQYEQALAIYHEVKDYKEVLALPFSAGETNGISNELDR